MPGWNMADIFEVIAEKLPEAPALAQGERRISWGELDRRADGIARALIDAGARRQDKVAHYLFNAPEYLESLVGIMKAGCVPVNTNYRYTDNELVYLWDNADAVAVVFHGSFADRIEGVREKVPRVRTWLFVDDGSGPCPDWAVPYEQAAESASGRTKPPWSRDGDDLYLLYTGGTTGMPKGVMWRQDDLVMTFNATNPLRLPEEPDLDHVRAALERPGRVALPACPLMHGTGSFTSMQALLAGGTVVLLPSRHFEASELLDAIDRYGVHSIAIVGDAFAKPILEALRADPGRWSLSTLIAIVSSGVMWSEATKQALLDFVPNALMVDAFSSSEALGMGQSVSSRQGRAKTARFSLGENARVIDEDGRDIEPGSGRIGRLAVKGRQPIGYYKDPEKSARTFVELDGVRYSVPGDFATVDADGTLRVLGRGSVCINTGGEKVYPEEVEEVLKTHAAIRDAVAVGVPDERFGEAVTAVVEPHSGAAIDEAEVIAHVKAHLAGYKAPRRVLEVDTIGRAPNGKVDYKRLRSYASKRLGAAG